MTMVMLVIEIYSGLLVRLFFQSLVSRSNPKVGAGTGSELNQNVVNGLTSGMQYQKALPSALIAHQRALLGAFDQSIVFIATRSEISAPKFLDV